MDDYSNRCQDVSELVKLGVQELGRLPESAIDEFVELVGNDSTLIEPSDVKRFRALCATIGFRMVGIAARQMREQLAASN